MQQDFCGADEYLLTESYSKQTDCHVDSSNKTLNFREKIPAKKVFPNLTFPLTNRAYCSYNERKVGIFMQKLSKAAIGRSYTIQWMFGVPEVMDFLREHHVEEGDNIQIIRKLKDALIVGVKGSRFAMGNEIADRIQV